MTDLNPFLRIKIYLRYIYFSASYELIIYSLRTKELVTINLEPIAKSLSKAVISLDLTRVYIITLYNHFVSLFL